MLEVPGCAHKGGIASMQLEIGHKHEECIHLRSTLLGKGPRGSNARGAKYLVYYAGVRNVQCSKI